MFDEEWERNSNKIKAHCKSLASQYKIDWGDLFTETFIRSRRGYTGARHFTTYVGQAAIWAAADMAKKSFWGKRFGPSPPPVESLDAYDYQKAGGHLSEMAICDRLDAESTAKDIPQPLKGALLRIFMGDTLAEVSADLGIGVGALKSRLARMRGRIASG